MADVGADLLLPGPDEVEETLGMLVGKSVTTKRIASPQVASFKGSVSIYTFDDEAVGAVIFCELGLTNSLGAAMVMIPAGAAEDATDEGEIPNNLLENFKEVANVLTAVMNDKRTHAKRVKLSKVLVAPDALDDETLSLLKSPARVGAFDVFIPGGYPGGEIRFCLA
ncbi:MAG: hypothetical protein M0019_04145 [Actinomycetota bacterium]|nr:hypothetical protein [Actinomycetota bacterium]